MDFFDGYIEFKKNVAVGEQGHLIKPEDFEKFAKTYGEERALGYLQAMNDFTAYAEVILGGGYCRNGVPESAHMARNYLRELVDHNRNFLSLMDSNSKLGFDK